MKEHSLLFLALLLTGCVTSTGNVSVNSFDSVEFTASDGTTLRADYYTPLNYNAETEAVVLLHQLSSDRKAWSTLAEHLKENGYAVLAVDLRGHGLSDGEWTSFTHQDFQDMVLDVEAAANFLEKNDVPKAKTHVVGASIGANTALNYAARDPSFKSVVLLSPSKDYRGIETVTAVNEYPGPVLIFTSKNDLQSHEDSVQLAAMREGVKLLEFPDAGHGTNMLNPKYEFEVKQALLDWLEEN